MIIDSFLFFQELDLLEIRLKYLYPHIDKFIIVEACQSFNGLKKNYNFEKNIKRYEKFLDKIIYYKITDFHNTPEELFQYLGEENNKALIFSLLKKHNHYNKKLIWWVLDSYHRECIHLALEKFCRLDDYIIISDLDEIPSLGIINKIKNKEINNFPIVCKQYEFKYYLNSLNKDNWLGSIASPYSLIKNRSLNLLRIKAKELHIAEYGGYHFTSVGGVNSLKQKIENWSHQEFNIKIVKENLMKNLSTGNDVFYRFNETKNKIVKMESSKIHDKVIKKIILDYKKLIILNEKKENFIDKLIYKYNQFLVYAIHIKNDPKKVTRKLSSVRKILFNKISNL